MGQIKVSLFFLQIFHLLFDKNHVAYKQNTVHSLTDSVFEDTFSLRHCIRCWGFLISKYQCLMPNAFWINEWMNESINHPWLRIIMTQGKRKLLAWILWEYRSQDLLKEHTAHATSSRGHRHNPVPASSLLSGAVFAPNTKDSIIQGIVCSAVNVKEEAKRMGDVKMLSTSLARGKLQPELFPRKEFRNQIQYKRKMTLCWFVPTVLSCVEMLTFSNIMGLFFQVMRHR